MRSLSEIRLLFVATMLFMASSVVMKADPPSKSSTNYVQKFTIDGIGYGLSTKGEIWVTSFPTTRYSDINIPDEIEVDGNIYPVVAIDDFKSEIMTFRTITIPRYLRNAYCRFISCTAFVVKWNAINCSARNFDLHINKLIVGEDVEQAWKCLSLTGVDSLEFNAKKLTGDFDFPSSGLYHVQAAFIML